MIARIRRIPRNLRDAGASAVEYGLLIAAIAAVIVGVVFGLGGIVSDTFHTTVDCINEAAKAPGCNPQP